MAKVLPSRVIKAGHKDREVQPCASGKQVSFKPDRTASKTYPASGSMHGQRTGRKGGEAVKMHPAAHPLARYAGSISREAMDELEEQLRLNRKQG